MKTLSRGLLGLLFIVTLVVLTSSHANAASSGKWINVIPGTELYGCVPDELATKLLAGGGFSTSGSPVAIFCIVGYTAVYRVLP